MLNAMQKKHFQLMILVTLTMCLCFGVATLAGAQSLPEIYGSNNSVNLSAPQSGVIIWLEKYWPFVALVISEALAFIPAPVNGIIQGILKIGNAIFKR
jgi:hypothetical protein